MQNFKLLKAFAGPVFALLVAIPLWINRGSWFGTVKAPESAKSDSQPAKAELKVLEIGSEARKNLKLVTKFTKPTDYWRFLSIPGEVQERPGVSDQGVTSPAVGVISEIHVFPGDTVHPGERLVTVQLVSEYLQASQTKLFQATQETQLLQTQIDRLKDAANSGAVSQSRIIELHNDIQRQETLARSARQELLSRGLSPTQINSVSSGEFVSTVYVVAPSPREPSVAIGNAHGSRLQTASFPGTNSTEPALAYEVQSLAVELGQTVQAGQLVANLSNHQSLYVVGHAFKREAEAIEEVARAERNIEIEFAEDSADHWPAIDQNFQIRHLSNSIDTVSRTFDFFVPLRNQSHTYSTTGETFVAWRFRPGQRTRIHIPVEKLEDVFVLPAEGMVREGPNAFVYQQNGDLFNQIPVNVLYEDRLNVVLANDGNITPGTYLAQNAAASLRRVLKAQSSSGQQPGLHVHADGTTHAAH